MRPRFHFKSENHRTAGVLWTKTELCNIKATSHSHYILASSTFTFHCLSEVLTGVKTHTVCGRRSFPWREGPGPSVWENSGSTNKPWFSNSHQPLGERRGWFFPNCVYHQSHRALYCQSNLLFEGICRCVLVKIKATFKMMFIHRRMIFNVFHVSLTVDLF